ncbi:MAG: Tol-Pal system beta propeller repeat protein TolB [Gammaproteobacteria bacterium]|nr:Tol-Pal system beta propeller repeat protein TolB [Gammaproteobacteria bacterium]
MLTKSSLLKNSALSIALFCLMPFNLSHAELQLEIVKAPDQAPQIAIVPFASDATLQPIIQSDLQRSGKFASGANLPAMPTTSQDVEANQQVWQNAKIPYVVVGQVRQNGNGFTVQYELVDVQKNTRLLGESMNVPANRMRAAAHLIADKIYQALTGIHGDFSGRIGYVLLDKVSGKRIYTLQVADTDGHEPRTVLTSKEPILSPTWTPDGKKLAYVSFESGRPAIYLQDLASGSREILAQYAGLNGAPSFSPDGRSMLFTTSKDGAPDIYQMDLATKQLRRLTNDSAIDTEARYAPDGKSFIFTSDRGGSPQIYRYNLEDGSSRRLTFKGSFNARGSLSRDGQTIAMVHRQGGQNFQIALQDLNSGIVTILTQTPLDESPSFSPNGQMIVYATRENGRGLLSIISTDGRFRMRLPSQTGEVREATWAPTN